jgi:hypothetical protein
MFYTNDAKIFGQLCCFPKNTERSLQPDSFGMVEEIIKEDSTVLEAYCTPPVTDKIA